MRQFIEEKLGLAQFLIIFFLFSPVKGILGAEALKQNKSESGEIASQNQVILPSTITLDQCFDWAVKQDEGLKEFAEIINQGKFNARASIGTAYPQIKWGIIETIQDTSGVDSGGSNGSILNRSRTDSKFNLNQPLFSGLREFSARKGYEKEVEKNQLLLINSTKQLFLRVSNAFYGIIQSQFDLNNTLTAIRLAKDRVDELNSRAKLGKTKESEVVSAQAQLSSLQAQEKRDQYQLFAAIEDLSFLTGKNLRGFYFQDKLNDDFKVPSQEESLRQLVNRSDIKAKEQELESKRYRIRYEKGFYWPHASADLNYYTQRSGIQKDVDWDLILSLDVPIYQGGTVSANVDKAISEYKQTKIQHDQLLRQARSQAVKAFASLQSSIEQSKFIEEAFVAASKSYELQKKEYRLGLVNNLEVLQAMSVLQEDKRMLDEARIKIKTEYLKLLVLLEQII